MKITIIILALILLVIPAQASVCNNLETLRQEWVLLEEKTEGGLRFSGPKEVRRLNTLRQIMHRSGSICIDFTKDNKVRLGAP